VKCPCTGNVRTMNKQFFAFLTVAAVLCAFSLALVVPAAHSASSEASVSSASSEDARILHLLNRITFGPSAEDVEAVKRVGIDKFIAAQLNPRTIPQNEDLNQLVASSDALSLPPLQLMKKYSKPLLTKAAEAKMSGDKEAVKKEIKEVYSEVTQQIMAAKLRRNIESPRQLQEVMTDFWFNHFNISINKGPQDRFLIGSFEQTAIRPHALGNFRELLGATAHHPAMLVYLDNWQNTQPNTPRARGRLKGINENYARELMELHTLGVDGGYTQQDVVALAHVLTGLGIPPVPALISGRGDFSDEGWYFDEGRHDFGDKVLLGKTIKGRGEAEIEEALDLLAMHPSTAHHISYQLAQYFVNDKPPAALVDKLSKTYLRTRGNIQAVMNDLLHSPEFWDSANIGVKYKSPYRYAISVVRASGANVERPRRLVQFSQQLGQPIYGCLTPDGYKNTQEAWLNPDGLLKRINFANSVTHGAFGRLPADQLERVNIAVAPRLSKQTSAAIFKAPQVQKAGLLLGSPEFMMY
jgi:uncharacterized protein (DUF1800 family)